MGGDVTIPLQSPISASAIVSHGNYTVSAYVHTCRASKKSIKQSQPRSEKGALLRRYTRVCSVLVSLCVRASACSGSARVPAKLIQSVLSWSTLFMIPILAEKELQCKVCMANGKKKKRMINRNRSLTRASLTSIPCVVSNIGDGQDTDLNFGPGSCLIRSTFSKPLNFGAEA